MAVVIIVDFRYGGLNSGTVCTTIDFRKGNGLCWHFIRRWRFSIDSVSSWISVISSTAHFPLFRRWISATIAMAAFWSPWPSTNFGLSGRQNKHSQAIRPGRLQITRNSRHGLYNTAKTGISNCHSWLITSSATNGNKVHTMP